MSKPVTYGLYVDTILSPRKLVLSQTAIGSRFMPRSILYISDTGELRRFKHTWRYGLVCNLVNTTVASEPDREFVQIREINHGSSRATHVSS